MTELQRLIFPFGFLLLLLSGASLVFGADTPMTSYLFSGLILILGAAALFVSKDMSLPQVVWVALAALTFSFTYDALTGRLVLGEVDYTVLVAALAVYSIAFYSAQTFSNTSRLWTVVLCLFLGLAIWAFVDFAINPEVIHGRPRPYHEDRLSAAFLSANTAATFFGIIMLASAASILRGLTKVASYSPVGIVESLFKHATVGVVTFLFAAVCLLLTASRAGLAFTAVSLTILTIWDLGARRGNLQQRGLDLKWALGLGGVIIIGLGLVLWAMSGDVAGARYAELDEDANSRMVMYQAYWQAVLERPLSGYGFGAFPVVNSQIMTADNAHVLATQGAAHNFMLQWLLQVGLIGTSLMLGITGAMLYAVWKGLATRRRHKTYLRTVLMMALFVTLHGLVDFAVEIPGLMWWFVLFLGLGGGIAIAGKPQQPQQD